jgi:thimet oligopeptidase
MDKVKPRDLIDSAEAIVIRLKQSAKLLKAGNIKALDTTNMLVFFMNKINLLKDVHPLDEVRAACIKAHIIVDNYISKTAYDVSEYNAYKKLLSDLESSPKQFVDREDKKLIEDIIEEYVRNGIAHKRKDKLKKIMNRLTRLCLEYEENITNNNTILKFERENLKGMPDYFLDGLERDINMYVVPLQASIVDTILKTCEVQKTRSLVYTENKNRCIHNNDILFQISQLRRKLATMLGYKSFADFILSTRMAGNAQHVFNFLQNILNKTRTFRNKQLEILRSVGFTNQAYDRLFYIEKIKKQFYKIDINEIRQYFPLEHVLKKIFKLLDRLMHITIKETPEISWHPDVRTFKIYQNNVVIGKFYADFYTRNNKFEGFACFPIINKILSQNEILSQSEGSIPSCALICNFSAPSNSNIDMEDRSSELCLLSHFHVEVLLHELGHVIHHIFGAAKYAVFSGSNTEHDFVETPSQMLEHLVWDPKIIKEISCHWKTREQLSDATIIMMLSGRLSGLDYSHQLVYSLFDQELHGGGFSSCKEMVERFKILRKEVEGIDAGDAGDATELTIFGHLAGEYGGAYYTYLWSKVFADDIYNMLEKYPIKWEDYVNKILRPGGTISAHEMMVNFLGREPNDKAFLSLL